MECIYLFIYLLASRFELLEPVNMLNHVNNFYMFVLRNSRGHRPIVDTCANEAIPQWGKHDLISHVYLQHHGHDEGDVQTLVMRVFLLRFVFQAVGAYSIKMEQSLS